MSDATRPREVLVGVKPGQDPGPLLELVRDRFRDVDAIRLVSLVVVGRDEADHELVAEVRAELEREVERQRRDGEQLHGQVEICTVSPGAFLAKEATATGAWHLVIGLAKRSRVGKALLGSDAQSVLLSAPCPVTCVRLD